MAYHHQNQTVPGDSQQGHWGNYQIPRGIPSLVNLMPSLVQQPMLPQQAQQPPQAMPAQQPPQAMPAQQPPQAMPAQQPLQARPVQQPLQARPVQQPLQAFQAPQPMELAEPSVQQQGMQHPPYSAMIAASQQKEEEAERENSYWRDQRSASRGREHKRRPFDRQEENWQQGGRQPGGRQRQTDRYGYPMEEASYRRRRSSSSTFSSQEERYLQEKQHPYKQRGGRNRGGASAPPKNKGKPPPPPKTGRGAKKGKDGKDAAPKLPNGQSAISNGQSAISNGQSVIPNGQSAANGQSAMNKLPNGQSVMFSTASRQLINGSMLPNEKWYIEDGLVHFQEGVKITSFPKALPDERAIKGKNIVFPVRPCLLVDNLAKATLPEPTEGGHPTLLANPWLCLKPRAQRCSHHVGGGVECSCIVQGTSGQYHRNTILPDTCLKRGLIGPADVAVAPEGLQLVENPQRFYQWSEEAGDHVLGLPAPFLIGGCWPPMPYEPAMALEEADSRSRLFYTLYDSGRFREVASLYTKPPREWAEAAHPYFGEPSPMGELGKITRTLYGLETLARTGFHSHPCAEPRVMLYCAVSREDRLVPVYVTDRSAPLRVEAAVTEIIRPWHEYGLGLILCSVCIVHTAPNAPTQLMWLARSEYILHWEQEHASSMGASYVFSATQLHVRLHLGHLAYVLALASRNRNKEDPKGMAISNLAIEQFGIQEHEEVLLDFLGPASNEEVNLLLDDLLDAPRASASEQVAMDTVPSSAGPTSEQGPSGHFLPRKNNKKKH